MLSILPPNKNLIARVIRLVLFAERSSMPFPPKEHHPSIMPNSPHQLVQVQIPILRMGLRNVSLVDTYSIATAFDHGLNGS
jgi:hypothetical protein